MAGAAESTCVILQPSYIPWRGYFDLISRADVFVFYDDVQYDKHGWRNRNRVKTASGTQWLTVPVLSKGNVLDGMLLRDARIASTTTWAKKHLATLRQSYSRSPFFKRYEPLVASFYDRYPDKLCDFTISTTLALAKELAITRPRFVRSSELSTTGERTERLIRILRAVNATHYISGPSARDYLDEAMFREANIGLEYIAYDYAEYEQLHPPYDPQVTILDLLFMKGEDAFSSIRKKA